MSTALGWPPEACAAQVSRPSNLGDDMAAGDRAAEQSRLASERVARLRRELDQAERRALAWSVGAAGEVKVAARVTSLEPHGWLALHDVRWPGRPKANLDHILVGPGGIVIVDAKNWSGDVRLVGGVLRQNGYRRDKEVTGVLQQVAAVTALLEPQHRRHAQGWICLAGQSSIQGTAPNGVRIQGLDTLTDAIKGMPAVLDGAEVRIIYGYLQRQLSNQTSPPLPTTEQVSDADAAVASLQRWRANQSVRNVTLRAPRQPNRRQTHSGCLKVLLQLTLLIIGMSIFMSYAFGPRPAAPVPPPPKPAVTQTVPAP